MPSVPTHIGYILDGNRRWAKKHGLPTYEGHLAGYNALHDVIDATVEAGVEYISFYTFSTKNWQRTEAEVHGIMSLVRRLLQSDVAQFIKKGYRIVVLGERTMIPEDIVRLIADAEAKSAAGTKATLAICFSYGGQEEIVRAAQRLIEQGVAASEINLELFAGALDQPSVPPCDLIVRTSGEQRLSDFMLWRSAYSELIFLDKLWPEMTKEDVAAILETYGARERRFGG